MHEDKLIISLFFFHDAATPEIYTLSLHDALPIFHLVRPHDEARLHVERRIGNRDGGARGLAVGAEGGANAQDAPRGADDGARSVDAYDLSVRHRLRAAAGGREGAAEGGGRYIQSADVPNEVS